MRTSHIFTRIYSQNQPNEGEYQRRYSEFFTRLKTMVVNHTKKLDQAGMHIGTTMEKQTWQVRTTKFCWRVTLPLNEEFPQWMGSNLRELGSQLGKITEEHDWINNI